MKLDSARGLQKEFLHQLRTGEPLEHHGAGGATAFAERRLPRDEPPQSPQAGGVAVGIAPRGKDSFSIAIQIQAEADETRRVVNYMTEAARDEVVVQYIGRVRPLNQGRTRPLVPGISIGHQLVTAGTLGAFVRISGSSEIHALSNNHVLAACDQGSPGDPILQPGPIDHTCGQLSHDQVGVLSEVIPLIPRPIANEIDAATCALSEDVLDRLDVGFPPGLTGPADPEENLPVKKIGRTTGETEGTILAFELQNLWVDYGPPLGSLVFKDQMSIIGGKGKSFSEGGDSGSLIFSTDPPEAIGLLFAGSETGPNGNPLTYANPLSPVLEQIHATLAL